MDGDCESFVGEEDRFLGENLKGDLMSNDLRFSGLFSAMWTGVLVALSIVSLRGVSVK